MKHPVATWHMSEEEFRQRLRIELLQTPADFPEGWNTRDAMAIVELRADNIACFAFNLVATELERSGELEGAKRYRRHADYYGAAPNERDDGDVAYPPNHHQRPTI